MINCLNNLTSICGEIKTKTINRMLISTLDSIVTIKTEFIFRKKYCNNFEITEKMQELFNINMYELIT